MSSIFTGKFDLVTNSNSHIHRARTEGSSEEDNVKISRHNHLWRYFDEESSTSSTSDEKALSQVAEKPRKPPGTAPASRMRLFLYQKLAAISHFQSNKMIHNELAQWMKNNSIGEGHWSFNHYQMARVDRWRADCHRVVAYCLGRRRDDCRWKLSKLAGTMPRYCLLL